MSKCVNINSTEFRDLVRATGVDPLILSAMMGNWMEINNTNEWPTADQLGLSRFPENNVRFNFKVTKSILENLSKIKSWENNKGIDKDTLWKKIGELGISKQQLDLLKESEGSTIEEKLSSFVAKYSYNVEINTAKESKRSLNEGIYGTLEEFKKQKEDRIKELERRLQNLENNNIQGAYDFSATSNSGKWNSANNELLSLVQHNRKAFAIYKFLIGDMQTFKEIVDFLNEKGIEIPYTDRMKRADETMTAEEKQSAIDSYNNSVSEKIEDKNQIEKDILSENNLQDETEYTPQELIEKYPLTGVQKVIWNLIKDIVNKLGIKVKFSSSRITEGFDGSNNPQNGEILIRPSTLKNGRFGEVLVHEIVHALTTKIISRVNSGVTTGLSQKQINAVKGLMKLFEAIKADNNLENKYPVKDVFEFIAHLTNEAFVKELKTKDKNFLQKVFDFILDILGINDANELSKKYLVDIISDGTFLEENGTTVLPSDYGNNLQGSKSEEIQNIKKEINQLKQEFERVGFGALKPIWNFYENTVTNILNKQGYSPKLITDEHGNTWNEISLYRNSIQIELPGKDKLLGNDLINDDIYLRITDLKYGNTNVQEKYFFDGNIQTIDTILDRIISSNNPLNKLAKHIKKAASATGVKIEFVSDDFQINGMDNNKWTGLYVGSKKTIYIKGKSYSSSEALLMHEIIHAVTVEYMKNNSEDQLVKELKSLYEYAKQNINTSDYGFTDEYEFIAELFTNSSFASKLSDIKATNPKKYSNLFEEFWDTIIKLLLKFYGKVSKEDSLYEQAFAIGTHIIENQYEQTMFMKEMMDISHLENDYNVTNFYFEENSPINKESILYKKLAKAFPDRHIDTMYRRLTSPSFLEWYGDGKLDEEGNPSVTSQYIVSRKYWEGYFNLFYDIKFQNKKEVEKFLSSLDSSGISKFKDSFYISKNNRDNAVTWIKRIESTHPGLLKLYPSKPQEGVLGGSDQSMHTVRIGINEDYFSKDFHAFIPTKKENAKTKADPRDYIIHRLQEFNVRIHNRLRDAKKNKNQEDIIKYEELFNKNVESIKELKDQKNTASIIRRAESDLNYVKMILSQENINSSDLIEVGRLIDLYANMAKTDSKSALISVDDLIPRSVVKVNEFGEETIVQDITDLTKSILELGKEFDKFSQLRDKIVKRIVTKEFNTVFEKDIEEDELFSEAVDLGLIDRTRGVLSMNNQLLNLLGVIRTAAIKRAEAESIRDEKVRLSMMDSLKKSSLFNRLGRSKFMDLFWQKDDKGNLTGGLINNYSNSYWKFINDYSSRMRSENKNTRKAAKKAHYNNHEYIHYFETEEEKQAEIKRLNNIFNDLSFVEDLINDQEERFIEYRERRDEKFEDIDGSDLNKESKQFEKDKWVKENNPSETINNLKSGRESSNPEGGVFLNSFEFVKSIPLKIDRTGKETTWFDSSFEEIQKDPIAKEYYEYVRKQFKDLLSFYPQSYLDSKGIHKGFIPQIKQGLLNDFKQEGLSHGLKGMFKFAGSLMKKWTTIKTYSKDTEHIDPGTGAAISTLNIAFLSPKYSTIEGGEVIDTNDVVKDIDDILSTFNPITNMYKHKSRIEGTYNIIAESIGLLKGVQTNKSNSLLMQKGSNEVYADSTNLNNLRELTQFELDTFYGVQASKNEKANQNKITTKEEKEELNKISDRLEEVNSLLSDRIALTEEQEAELEREKIDLEVKQKDIGVSFSTTKTGKSFLKWYQLLAQGWNIHSPVIELIYGYMTNFTHATGRGDFTTKQIKRAYRIAIKSVTASGTTSESRKFNNIIEKFNVIGEVFENDSNGQNSRNRVSLKNVIKPYHAAKNSDKITKGSAAVAILMNTEIFDINGDKSNLYDALDENMDLKPEFQTDFNIENWTVNIESTEINEIQRLSLKINEVNIRNTGNYDPNQPIPFNSKLAGQAILQFRRWLLEGFAQRFEKERYSSILGRTVKGRFVTYKDLGFKKSVPTIFKMMLKKVTFREITEEDFENWEIDDPTDIENMRKNATGAIITIMLTMAMLMLSKAFDDDDEKDFGLMNYMLNMGGRLQQDLWFYSSPGTANDFLGNIVPSARLYDKITGWMEASFKQIFPDYDQDWSTEYERGELKGWNKMGIKTGELIPGSSAIIKTYRLGAKVIE